MSSEAQKYRVLTDTFADTFERYDAHWTPEYRAKIKARADAEWAAESARYDALRNPRIKWPAHWTEKEKYEASAHLRGADQ